MADAVDPNQEAEDSRSLKEKFGLAAIGLLTPLLGGVLGGSTGAMAGGASGLKAIGGGLEQANTREWEEQKTTKAAEAAEAKRKKELEDELVQHRKKKEIDAQNKTPEGPKPLQQSSYQDKDGNPLLYDPNTNDYVAAGTPGAVKRVQTQTSMQLSPYQDENGNPLVYDPKTASLSPVNAGGNTVQKPLSASDTARTVGGEDAFTILDELDEHLAGNEKLFGPVAGRVGAANPYNEESQVMQSRLKSSAQIVGKYMEDGVLRKEDEAKYERMLPNMNDTPEVAKKKLAIVREMIKGKYEKQVSALGKQGYSTKGLNANQSAKTPIDVDKLSDAEVDAMLKERGLAK